MRDTGSKVDVVVGDGRLALDREPGRISISSTRRLFGRFRPRSSPHQGAFSIYFRHVKPSGMLAVNVSNAYLDIKSL